ncbi:MAG TPA: FAD-binding oxidoreductase [Alphaproteobacteria bacterium]|nr:FAD-binding oxidoreductase [Alphaproteobacteria bacterium]
MAAQRFDIAVIGAGIVGIACAYYLALAKRRPKVTLIDPLAPMSLTSAASGENYRNWWPHPVMTAFTDYSIDLMEVISDESDNRLRMTRRGYALATRRAAPEPLIRQLYEGYGSQGAAKIRIHEKGAGSIYQPALSADWHIAPDGVDVIQDRSIIAQHFPSFDREVATILHIRRAGDISGQQLGSYMIERVHAMGGRLTQGRVVAVQRATPFELAVANEEGTASLRADILINAAGPYVPEIAALLGETLPLANVFQQKIAFEDVHGVISRQMPFSIDLDGQVIDWTKDERAVLADDPATKWLTELMPGAIHCRPDGGEHGRWIKLGWAYNRHPSAPGPDLPLDPSFPEIVLRGASRLNPGLRAYYGRRPSRVSHYGGYYTMTKENWPLIGPMATKDAYIAGALSGYGTMAACATGALVAAWVHGEPLPGFARPLSLARYGDKSLMQRLLSTENTGVL